MGVSPCHKTSELLEVRNEELSKEVGSSEDMVNQLKGREANFSMFFGKVVHHHFISSPNNGITLPEYKTGDHGPTVSLGPSHRCKP